LKQPLQTEEDDVSGHESTGRLAGLGLGVVLALAFALVIAQLPEQWFVDTGPRAVLYAAQVVAAPAFVLVARAVGRVVSAPSRTVLLWAVAGALAVDGLAIGFWPSVYGQTGDALTWVAATLLWAFAWIVAAGMVMTRQPDEAPAGLESRV
jgi:hypothetical protein